jgi:2',3'-cyclic-nucleotide 2'-phosphodiesterase (5'-nucleotidase family)
VTLSIVTTNDMHGHIQQLPLLGGYVSNLRRVREREGGAVLLLDAGDIFQGTLESNLSEGAAAIRGYNALGYAAAAIGNHEFDFGPVGPYPTPRARNDDPLGALAARVGEARFPMLSANLRAKSGGAFPIAAVQPSTTLEVAGVRVGIVGGITEGALTRTHPGNTGGVALEPLAASVATEARRLRAQGAVVVIAVVHAGGECHAFGEPTDLSSCDLQGEIFQLAAQLPAGEVDVIVAGHTHEGIAHRVNGIAVVEAYAQGRAFSRVDLVVDRERGRIVSERIHLPQSLCRENLSAPICTTHTYEGASVRRDATVLDAIAADLQRAQVERARLLGVEVVASVERSHDSESALGNLVADLMRDAFPGASAAINNGGSIRTDLPVGELTYGQLFEVFPFDNVFATLELTAGELGSMIAVNLQNDRGFLALSGLEARASCRAGALAVRLFRDGSPVPESFRLRVITSDFLARGGDGLLAESTPYRIAIHDDRLMRDALVTGLARYPRLSGGDRRFFDPARPRIRYPGPRPVRCLARP